MSQPYFVEHKRGEIEDIRNQLSNPRIKDKQDVIKKVIAYMSLGVDMSRLYTNMIMASSTNDPVQKKMVYNYICTYAQEKPDLAILCINTLQRDCRDQDPMIRALALRSLCSLRLPNICEYALDPLRQSLNDRSSYVRRTAVLAYTKLHAFLPHVIQESEPQLLSTLYEMRQDVDPLVVINVLNSIDQILTKILEQIHRYEDEGMAYTVPFGLDPQQLAEKGISYYISTSFILPFFNSFTSFPEWGQCAILELATRYTPQSEDEMYDIMNLLETTLSHCNSAVVLAAVKLFLHITKGNSDLQQQVYDRIKTPLITHLITAPIELGYVVLSHLKIIAIKSPAVLQDDYKYFFCRYHDTSHIKVLKIEILSLIANQHNSENILNELNVYVFEKEEEIAEAAIKAIGYMAVVVPSISETSIDLLLSLLDHKHDIISNSVILACRDVLRKYPDRYSSIVPILQKILQERDLTEFKSTSHGVSSTFESSKRQLDDNNAISAIVWMLGEFGQDIPAAPYILETMVNSLIDAVESIHEASIDTTATSPMNTIPVETVVREQIQIELLFACVKLLFKRPPEIHKTLGRLFKVLINGDDSGQLIDITAKQKAAMYYRMLASSTSETAKVINGPKQPITRSFWEYEFAQSEAGMSFLIEEFNTLSVIYGFPESAFRKLKSQLTAEESETADDTAGGDSDTHDTTTHHEQPHVESETHDVHGFLNGEGATTNATEQQGNILDITSEHHDHDGGDDQSPLTPDVELDPDTFQELWGSLPESSIEFAISEDAVNSTDQIESMLAQQHVYTMATGEADGVYKYYLYGMNTNIECQDGQPLVFLLECAIEQSTGSVVATLKTNGDEDQSTEFYNIVGSIMTSL